MTPELQQEVALFSQSDWIAKVPFFNAKQEYERDKFVAAVAMKLVPTAFPPNETIYMMGEPADMMFILTRGIVRRKATMLSKGSFFGEEMIMTDAVRMESTSTLTFVDCQQLTRVDLWQVLGVEEGTIAKTFVETRELVRKAAIRMSLKKVVLEIGRSVIVLKKDNWAKWGKRYTRMSDIEVESFKSLMSQRLAEHEAKYGTPEEVNDHLQKAQAREDREKELQQGVANETLKYWTGRDYSKWGNVSKEKILGLAKNSLKKKAGAFGLGGGLASKLKANSATPAAEEDSHMLGPRQELPDAPVLSEEERKALTKPPNFDDIVGGRIIKPLASRKEPETEQGIFQEELQLRMQEKLDEKMTEMQQTITQSMDSVLSKAVQKFASEMAELKGMCEDELEKTQSMLTNLAANGATFA